MSLPDVTRADVPREAPMDNAEDETVLQRYSATAAPTDQEDTRCHANPPKTPKPADN